MLICLSCGQTYRPVATPIIPSLPNPGFSHFAVVISGNDFIHPHPGASTSINVSGDTAESQSTVGLMPVQAAVVLNGTRVYVANSQDDTVSSFSPTSPTPVTTIRFGSQFRGYRGERFGLRRELREQYGFRDHHG
jgi:P pilus assembly chaperone PapD